MGISLPTLAQPGEATRAVLGEAERGWMLMVAAVLLAAVVSELAHGLLVATIFATALALCYGIVGDFSDLLFGFWGTAALVFVPAFLVLSWLARRLLPGRIGRAAAGLLILFGVIYPTVAGLDPDRQSLYLNVCHIAFLAFLAWALSRRLGEQRAKMEESVAAGP